MRHQEKVYAALRDLGQHNRACQGAAFTDYGDSWRFARLVSLHSRQRHLLACKLGVSYVDAPSANIAGSTGFAYGGSAGRPSTRLC